MSNVINDTQGSRFVITIDNFEAYVLYAEGKETIDLYSTFTPRELRGKGLAEKVVKAAFEYARENGLKVIPTCPYIRTFIERNPDYQKDIADKN